MKANAHNAQRTRSPTCLLFDTKERSRTEICQPRDKIGRQMSDCRNWQQFGFAESHLKRELSHGYLRQIGS